MLCGLPSCKSTSKIWTPLRKIRSKIKTRNKKRSCYFSERFGFT
jgi:hypothetical protein